MATQDEKANDTAGWPDPADQAYAVEHAAKLRDQAAKGGLRFEAYLPPDLAIWLLDRIQQGTFLDPSEATFALLREARELEPHADLRRELLKRRLQVAMDDPRPGIPIDEAFDSLRKKLAAPRPGPARWEKKPKRQTSPS